MKKILGRDLHTSECVHHINGNTLDNAPANLIVVTHSHHGWLHRFNIQRCVASLLKSVTGFNNGVYYEIGRN
ncbi:HNH endonuclease [Candidatus Woesebacteria bacterium]|nr:HNH endonuclease [Candidatus Woesebacteria bacterium]